jgi:hypothetical protein
MPAKDVRKELKQLYLPPTGGFATVDVPDMSFIMVDGVGDPNTASAFQNAVGALYSLAYTLKFMLKKEGRTPDFVVPPLEGLWWTCEEGGGFDHEARGTWRWTVMIMQPDHVTREHFERAGGQVEAKARKKKEPVPRALAKARFQRFHEGLSVQTMHVGPFSAEGPVIARMHAHAAEQGLRLRGKHHEIYLSDPRRVPEEKWRTVLRQPVERA